MTLLEHPTLDEQALWCIYNHYFQWVWKQTSQCDGLSQSQEAPVSLVFIVPQFLVLLFKTYWTKSPSSVKHLKSMAEILPWSRTNGLYVTFLQCKCSYHILHGTKIEACTPVNDLYIWFHFLPFHVCCLGTRQQTPQSFSTSLKIKVEAEIFFNLEMILWSWI